MKLKVGTFAQIDTTFDEHRRYYDYGAAELGVIACGITCANRLMSDGVLHKSWPVRRFGPEVQSIVDRLVKDGVWRLLPNGDYEIDGFLEHNRSKAEILEIKEKRVNAGKQGGKKSAEARGQAQAKPSASPRAQGHAEPSASPRAKANGEARAQGHAEPTVLDPYTDTDPETDPQSETTSQAKPKTEPPPPGVGDDVLRTGVHRLPESELRLWGDLRIEHYQHAATHALGRRWAFDKKQLQELYDAIAVHCEDKTRIEAWIDEVVPAFVNATRTDQPKYWSGHQPRGLAKWLNEGGVANVGDGANGAQRGSSGVDKQVVMGKLVYIATGEPVDG